MQEIESSQVRTRIAWRVADLGMSVREVSLAAGLNADTLGKYLTGKSQSLKASNLAAVARALDVSESWLLGSSDDVAVLGKAPFGVKLGGIIEEDAFRREDGVNHGAESRRIAIPHDPRYPPSEQLAFSVAGDSGANAKIFEGMQVLGVDIKAWEMINGHPNDGKLVVVARYRNNKTERELTIGRLRIFPDRMELRPENNNMSRQPIIFALPHKQSEKAEAAIIAIVLSAQWIFT